MAVTKKLGPRMKQILVDLLCGADPTRHCCSQSDYGGLHTAMFALWQRGLVDPKTSALTDTGKAEAKKLFEEG